MNKIKILVIEDEGSIRRLIKKTLEAEKMIVTDCESGYQALEHIKLETFDMAIVDLMLEDMNGLDLIRQIQQLDRAILVIILSGKSEDSDKIIGLGIGADDYITKPFSPSVLSAKVRAHIRRRQKLTSNFKVLNNLIIGPFRFDLNTFQFFKNGEEIILSSKEMMMVKFFMENPNQVFSKEQIYVNIWKNEIVDENAIMVYISHLRSKLEDDPKNPIFIKTVWGIGYMFKTDKKTKGSVS